jgi:hypothetical protein
MTRHKTEDAAKFAKMVGGNMRFLRLNHTPFRPQKVLVLKPQEGIGSLEEIMEAVKCP